MSLIIAETAAEPSELLAPAELTPELEAPAVEAAAEAAVEIAVIEAERDIALAETGAAVELARIEQGDAWQSQVESRLAELSETVNNLPSLIQQALATASRAEETATETAETLAEVLEPEAETTSLSTPQSTATPSDETPTGHIDDVEGPAVAPQEQVEAVPEIVVGIKRKRIIL